MLANAEVTSRKSVKLYDLFGYSDMTSNSQVSIIFFIWKTKQEFLLLEPISFILLE